ncbi:bile acid:sodium symporter family protein [Xanthovirga aplysinae]|uniref:bile acid:sodium symporter family protein n=1 Tax=Xanthovirga aplysinae TaxID=2529853 RepID=UPI0012BB8097|nr:bile acid:sodium symporter family protein [Xanthovirga aplysinae]MTI32567.1 bile acid:sodium symporter family protein [Xanthovirga aplysinae]
MKHIFKINEFIGKTLAFWILLVALLAFIIPENFKWIAPFIPYLLGLIMFGMGLSLQPKDFSEVVRRPKDVFIGLLTQFLLMPLLAFSLSWVLNLPTEVAIGVLLVGCCPGGTASNVITYISGGDVPLSITITSLSTLLAPLLTPLLMWIFASQWISISLIEMFWSIFQIILIPIVFGVFIRTYFKKQVEASVEILPTISIISIAAIVGAIIALNKENIFSSGILISSVVVIHNLLGLFLGYGMAQLFKLPLAKRKAISIEVGMQNSGLATVLATAYFSPLVAVPGALFSVWHNISGTLLASWWRKRGVNDKIKTETPDLQEEKVDGY